MIFWAVISILVQLYQHFRGLYCLYLQSQRVLLLQY
jgi:hypothetical protein